MWMLGKKRHSDDPERFCSPTDPGQSHNLLMPYKTSPATLSQHKTPRSFELPENTQTFLCFKIALSWDQQCICGESSQSLLLLSSQEMPCQDRLSCCKFLQRAHAHPRTTHKPLWLWSWVLGKQQLNQTKTVWSSVQSMASSMAMGWGRPLPRTLGSTAPVNLSPTTYMELHCSYTQELKTNRKVKDEQ